MEFFKSFFKNDSSRQPDELNENYVLVGDQSVNAFARRLRFELESASSLNMDWESAPDGGEIAALIINGTEYPAEG